jgi:small subunit ribosomal protein S17
MARRQKVGLVVSNKMDKSAVVTTKTLYKHKMYGKVLSKTKRFLVHDPENSCAVGNTVLVEEHRPISLHKHWILKTILK